MDREWATSAPIQQHNAKPTLSAFLASYYTGVSFDSLLTSNDLPASLEFDVPAGSDRSLLRLGLSVEALFGSLPPPP